MREPELVAECVSAMRGKVPVTVKHRTGVDAIEDYDFLSKFVEKVARAGCGTFIVHARNAILKGLSPKENREIPPLKYQYVYRLKEDFPDLEVVLNGGITSSVARHMLGLYHGMPRARRWRQMLSDSTALKRNDPNLLLEAIDEVEAEESRIGA